MFVVKNTVCPDILKASNLYGKNEIASAYSIQWYFAGGENVICLNKGNGDILRTYVPSFSGIIESGLESVLKDMESLIMSEIQRLKIPLETWFLFDTKTKAILDTSSFINFLPYYNMTKAIFILVDKDGKVEGPIRYMADKTTYGVLNMLSFMIAKLELQPACNGKEWTAEGKTLLNILVAHQHRKDISFTSPTGMWTNVQYEFPTERLSSIPINLSKLKLTKALQLAKKIDVEPNPFSSPQEDMSSLDKSGILLSEVLEIGVDSFTGGTYGLVDVQIDMCADVYSAITIDGKTGVCLVRLCAGVKRTIDEIKEELNADDVQISNLDDNNEKGDLANG